MTSLTNHPASIDLVRKLVGQLVAANVESACRQSCPSRKFMLGLPMNPATKRFLGRLYTS